MKWSSFIGGGLGWAFGGPIGGILGFIIGSMFGNLADGNNKTAGNTRHGDFMMSVLILSAAVMKADGKIMKSELNFVKNFFIRNAGESRASEYILMLREILKQDININDVCSQINANMDYSSKLQLLHYLFALSQSDDLVSKEEISIINAIARKLAIPDMEFESVKAMFVKNTTSAYTVLGIEVSATDDEIKKAYRTMASIHHPDKVAHLGDDVQKEAKEKFQSINSAYEQIKKERGIK